MLWETLWALVVGFTLSGAVQAFVTRGQMERALGRPGARSLARATFLGMVSSSCSYAATAMAKSLFAKGADFAAALVFMIASTNLVVELGIVLALLVGWQFTVSEFIGGFLMIALFGLLSRFLLPRSLVDGARERVRAGSAAVEHAHHSPSAVHTEVHEQQLATAPLRKRIATLAGWADAAGYAIADLTMLRRELLIGYTVAGFLAALVPDSLWGHLFVSGHGFASSLENVLVGPLIAILSFVCSVGNVPLAAALWKGGISFGGVIAFVFADLITLPLLLIYRGYYGGRLTLRILAGFWLVMSTSGLAIEYLFGALRAIPSTRPTQIAQESLTLNYTTVLNVLAVLGFAFLYALHRARARQGSSAFARDPVCGMQVEVASAPARRIHDGAAVHFCSDRCAERFDRRRLDEPVATAATGDNPTA
ncbi:MAG: permease [Candidatus Dormibacteraeota bacterium]|nr:permease [Candidatus Dormibacteraeota bacterium]